MVAHLCARLLESSAEIRSTILVQRVYRSFLERTGRGDLVERARAAKARARAQAAADRAASRSAAAAAAVDGAVPFTPPARRGSGVATAQPAAAAAAAVASRPLPEQTMYVSERQRAHLAAVTIQRWWAAGADERLRRLGLATAATAVQAAWRGRAAREAVRSERAELVERAESERERRTSEVCSRVISCKPTVFCGVPVRLKCLLLGSLSLSTPNPVKMKRTPLIDSNPFLE